MRSIWPLRALSHYYFLSWLTIVRFYPNPCHRGSYDPCLAYQNLWMIYLIQILRDRRSTFHWNLLALKMETCILKHYGQILASIFIFWKRMFFHIDWQIWSKELGNREGNKNTFTGETYLSKSCSSRSINFRGVLPVTAQHFCLYCINKINWNRRKKIIHMERRTNLLDWEYAWEWDLHQWKNYYHH